MMGDFLGMGLFIIAIILIAGFFLVGRGSNRVLPESTETKHDFAHWPGPAAETETELAKLAEAGQMGAIDQVVDSLDNYSAEKQQMIKDFVHEQGIVKRYQAGLADIDYKVRAVNAERLGKIGGSGTAEALFTAMSDKNEEVRMSATTALKKMADPSVAEALVQALQDPYKWLPARIAEVLVALGPAAVPALHRALAEKDSAIRGYIIEILGEIGDHTSALPLNQALQDKNANIRLQAARALGRIGQSCSVQPLIGLLEDPEVKVKVQAIRSLGEIGDPEAVQYLTPYRAVNDQAVSFALSEALNKLSAGHNKAKVVIKYE